MDLRAGRPHPEQNQAAGLEPTVDEQIRLGRFVASLEEATVEQLRHWCRLLAQQAMVLQPAAMRYLAREAARNLAGAPWGREAQEELLAEWMSPDRAEGS